MHAQSIQPLVNHTQADSNQNTTALAEARQRAFDIESCALDGAILIDALFRTIDGMGTAPADLHHQLQAINCFATCAKRNLVLILEASQDVLTLTAQAGVPA